MVSLAFCAEHVGERFVTFLLDTIESADVEEEVAELSLGTLLSLNLHLHSEVDNFVLRTLATRKDARALTERLMLLVNREGTSAVHCNSRTALFTLEYESSEISAQI